MHRPWLPLPALPLLLLFLSFFPPSFSDEDNYFELCRPRQFTCGNHAINVSYPFNLDDRHPECGHPNFSLRCNKDAITMEIGDKPYQVKDDFIDYTNHNLTLVDLDFLGKVCPRPSENTTMQLDRAMFDDSDTDFNVTFFIGCPSFISVSSQYVIDCLTDAAEQQWSYYWLDSFGSWPRGADICPTVQVPMSKEAVDLMVREGAKFLGEALQEGFTVLWTEEVWGNCSNCTKFGGVCGYNFSSPPPRQTCFYCPYGLGTDGSCSRGSDKNHIGIIIGVCVGVGGLVLATLCGLFFYRHGKRRRQSSTLLPRTVSSELFSKADQESGSELQSTQIFQYEELHEATDGFNASNELGDGGFGTVYKGNLKDGRTVAIKRLYENNYRRVEQFMTEVSILSSLRHQNLVSLYGCTSRHSRELLLVYEYVPNGTVADHLHGSSAGKEGLPWPVRLSIAIETADALSYLHAVTPHQIIHRDVKTNNILLDSSFRVKVADFGLSRLFPINATHVSTAPQGTPGYVDPEYYQCYQLTDKSDVYSFGVVLVELISSKPAVDLSRQRHEVNLASFAMCKIQNEELDQLVDSNLWGQSSGEVIWMIRQVAELAFRCLQGEREMRPTMREVLEALRGIENVKGCSRAKGSVDADTAKEKDDECLLTEQPPHSPDTVTAKWESRFTTPNASV